MFRAVWTFQNQTIAGTMRIPNGKSQSPVRVLTPVSMPARSYIFLIARGTRKALTGKSRIQRSMPRTPPGPSPVFCFSVL